uniref:Uncharacterized protein n=1 Tax=Rhizophora mucronata TaxID=61149 RepID=A0A2P2MLZ6_RHIMU
MKVKRRSEDQGYQSPNTVLHITPIKKRSLSGLNAQKTQESERNWRI